MRGTSKRLLTPLFAPRVWNIGLRTAHLAAMGMLLGGHAFEVPKERLLGVLGACVATGVALAAVEAGPRLLWFHQGRGLMTLAKLGLILAVPLFWNERLYLLLAVVVIASVGSHMSARFRYYSVLQGRVIRCGSGPGVANLPEEVPPPDKSSEPDGPLMDGDSQPG